MTKQLVALALAAAFGFAHAADVKPAAEVKPAAAVVKSEAPKPEAKTPEVKPAVAATEAKDKDSQARISELGSRLNVALAQRVQELARYRSDFFGRLRQVLGTRPD